jgi:prepilin-type N-terminal cleavage/methylation domain-containing protein
MKSIKNLQKGFTLVEIMIVVAIIGLLAAIAIPNFVRARESAQTNACVNNLRQIDGAKQQWALETRQTGGQTPVATDIAPYLGRGQSVTAILCPSGGATATFSSSYNILAVTNPPTCAILPAIHILQ